MGIRKQLASVFTLGLSLVGVSCSSLAVDPPEVKSPLDLTVKNIEGSDVNLSQYKGKAVLIVNVASKCGLTPQYDALEAVYRKYKDRGLVVLGFPANNFLGQEPGTNEEIATFCRTKFDVSFPMFAKISAKGEDIAPLYAWLTSEKSNPGFSGDIEWNFGKFLVDPSGKVVARFHPKKKPDAAEVTAAIEKALPPAEIKPEPDAPSEK